MQGTSGKWKVESAGDEIRHLTDEFGVCFSREYRFLSAGQVWVKNGMFFARHCKRMFLSTINYQLSTAPALWHSFCFITGKAKAGLTE